MESQARVPQILALFIINSAREGLNGIYAKPLANRGESPLLIKPILYVVYAFFSISHMSVWQTNVFTSSNMITKEIHYLHKHNVRFFNNVQSIPESLLLIILCQYDYFCSSFTLIFVDLLSYQPETTKQSLLMRKPTIWVSNKVQAQTRLYCHKRRLDLNFIFK